MSHTKKNRSIFLLSKLKLFDYLIVLGAMVFLLALYGYLRIYDEPDTPNKYAAQLVPIRSIKATYNVSQLWGKEGIYLAQENYDRRFFIADGRNLIFPTINQSEAAYALQAINVTAGQTLWQTDLPDRLGIMRIYDGKFFVLSDEKLGQAPVKDNQELPYCSFRQRYSLSAYDVTTGEKLWGYSYQGVSSEGLNFDPHHVYLSGTDDHGASGLLVKVDINSGTILEQQCTRTGLGVGKSVPVPPRDSEVGVAGSSFLATAVDNQESGFGCMRDNRLCFVTQENRLNILAGNTRGTLAFVEFDGEKLNPHYVDIVVQNNLVVIHLNDSNQLFAFRLP